MNLAIIAAMNEELEALIKHFEVKKIDTLNSCDLYQLNNKSVYFLTCGVGKVNAAITTTLLITKYSIDKVISIGTAGGVLEGMKITDLVIADKMAFHDDITPFGYLPGQLPAKEQYVTIRDFSQEKAIVEALNLDFHIGTIVTGDQFVNDKCVVATIENNFKNVTAIEMESTAIVMVCQALDVDVVVVRSISDLANHESTMSFDKYLEIACQNFVNFAEEVIKGVK